MIRDEAREDVAAKEERDDGNADAGGGGEEPDQNNERANTEAEVRRNIKFCKHLVSTTMDSVVLFWKTVDSIPVLIDFKERLRVFGDSNLIRSGSTYIATVTKKVGVHVTILREELPAFSDRHCRISSFTSQSIPPCSANMMSLFVVFLLTKQKL